MTMQFVRKGLLTIQGQFLPPQGYVGPWGNPGGWWNGGACTGPTAPAFPTGAWWYGPSGPTGPQPSTTTCVLSYYGPNNQPSWSIPQGPWSPGMATGPTSPPSTSTIALALQVDGKTWLGQWDSSVADGRVDWVVYSIGATVAAAQGTFFVQANSANSSVP
jgi:hypothetical protein